jgi:hypothetical protein
MVEACRTSGPLNLHFAESGVRVAVDDQDTVGRPCRERAKVSHGVRVQWDAGLNFDVHVIAAAAALRSLTSWATHVILHRRKTTSPFADRHLLTHAPLQTCLLWLLQTFWRVPNKPAAPVAPRVSQDKRHRGIGHPSRCGSPTVLIMDGPGRLVRAQRDPDRAGSRKASSRHGSQGWCSGKRG